MDSPSNTGVILEGKYNLVPSNFGGDVEFRADAAQNYGMHGQ
jgi:hypothetical protein